MKSCKLNSNQLQILIALSKSEGGLKVSLLKEVIKLPQRTIYYCLNKLNKNGFIERTYPYWKLCRSQGEMPELAKLLSKYPIESHDFSFVLRLIKKPKWWERRENRLERLLKIKVKRIKWGNNTYFQSNYYKYVIQTFSNSMIFICTERYLGNDSYECFIQAVEDFLEAYHHLEEKTRFRFFLEGVPQVSIRSHHYNKLRDLIALKCKKEGKLFGVEIEGNLRLWVDMSEPLGTETGHKNYAPEDMRIYKRHVDDILKNNPPTNSELQEMIIDSNLGIKEAIEKVAKKLEISS